MVLTTFNKELYEQGLKEDATKEANEKIATLRKQLQTSEKQNKEKDEQLQEKDEQLQEKDEQLRAKDKYIAELEAKNAKANS